MIAPVKYHMLNGWVATTSSAVVVTAFRRLITVSAMTRHLEVRA